MLFILYVHRSARCRHGVRTVIISIITHHIHNEASILLDDVHLEKIKVDILHKIILRKAGLSMPLEITYVAVKPDGLSQVKSKAGILKCLKDLVCTCVVTVILYCNITHQVRVSINLKPNTHIILPKVFSDDCTHT